VNLSELLVKLLQPKEDVSENVKKNVDFIKEQTDKLKKILEKKNTKNDDK